MKYRKIGDTGIAASILGCGGFRLPTVGGNDSAIDRNAAATVFDYALDHGVNFFDTSSVYHGGDSERFLGEFHGSRGARSRMILCTKLPTWMVNATDDLERMLNESLQRLQTDYVDFYLLHMLNPERWQHLKCLGVVEFLDKIVADGRVRHVGFSSHEVSSLALLRDYDRFKLVLKQYNYLDRNLQGAEDVIAHSQAGGYGVAVMEPLRGGMLGERMPKKWQPFLDQVKVDGSPAMKGLFWVMSNPGVSVTLSGMGRLEHVVQNVAAAELLDSTEMTDQLAQQYDRATADLKHRQVVRCTACGYCAPSCPKNIPIAYNLELLNFLAAELGIEKRKDLLRVNSVAVPALGAHFSVIRNFSDLSEGQRASACVGCRKCEEHCPQQIRIADELATFAYILRSDQLPAQGETQVPLTIKNLVLRSRWRNQWLPDGSRQYKLLKGIWRAASRCLPVKRSYGNT
jgi:uncharacterized protein